MRALVVSDQSPRAGDVHDRCGAEHERADAGPPTGDPRFLTQRDEESGGALDGELGHAALSSTRAIRAVTGDSRIVLAPLASETPSGRSVFGETRSVIRLKRIASARCPWRSVVWRRSPLPNSARPAI